MNPISTAAVEAFERTAARMRLQVRERLARGEQTMNEAELDEFLAVRRGALLRELTMQLAERELPTVAAEHADEWTAARRTEANLAAMHLLASKPAAAMTPDDRLVLARYSDWGGLSIEKVQHKLPPSLQVDPQSLIHAYYTPSALSAEIARVTAPLLPGLRGADGIVRALEPAAGIGRLIRAFDGLVGRPPIRWTAIELSSLAARLLAAVRPGLSVYAEPFERWIAGHTAEVAGTLGLVICNPPFSERGVAQFEDPDRDYREDMAAAYFVRRALDLLAPGGLGVFIIPMGYLSGSSHEAWRRRVLVRHHLSAAFRLPSHVRSSDGRIRALFPGTHNVVDLLFFRRRAGELQEVDEADEFIARGGYFDATPGHVLGEVDGSGKWLKIVGPPVRLPNLLERTVCHDCRFQVTDVPTAAAEAAKTEPPAEEDPRVTMARSLGERVDRYLGALSAGRGIDPVLLWPELHAALSDWTRQYGSPYAPENLKVLADDRRASSSFLRAFDHDGRLIPGLQNAPTYHEQYTGPQGDPVALAEHLYRTERGLLVARLVEALGENGVPMPKDMALGLLFAAGWCIDGPGLSQLVPREDYLSGDLWVRHDHLQAHPDHPRAAVQLSMLVEAIGPVLLGDLGNYSVREGWIPTALIHEFMRDTFGAGIAHRTLLRKDGLVQLEGLDYADLDEIESISGEAIAFLGWLNHDLRIFKPERKRGQSILEARDEHEERWSETFRQWVTESSRRTERLLAAYNRAMRGFRQPTYSDAPLPLARWTTEPGRQLHDYQRAAVRRIMANRGGILSLDVGLGKTATALGSIAALRQAGTIRRPVILVPNSLVFQWYAEIRKFLPDYRVGIIGAKFVVRQRGERRGETDSAIDTPTERAAKWARFQAGEYDLVLLTYSALSRTKIDLDAAGETARETPAVARKISMKIRTLRKKVPPAERSERERAMVSERTPAWIYELLELPEGWEYDGDVVWDDLGIDWICIDELHNYKNLFQPEARQRGLPAFMGSGGEGSGRAWQLFFRSAAVRRKNGGAGVLGLTATVAKNGPTELYSAFCYINPQAWTDLGIDDAERFIDQFCELQPRPVVTTAMTLEVRDAMVGFKNLRDLRTILTRYIEFKNATEAAAAGKIKKPKASSELVRVTMNEHQRDKLAGFVGRTRAKVKVSGEGELFVEEDTKGPDLGMIVRLGLVAIHPQLDEGYTYETALDGGDGPEGPLLRPKTYSSPKFDAVADRVLANAGCGHIVFLEPIAGQVWLREVLVQRGIPRERVALLNAVVAPTAAKRLDIAERFNKGEYVVVIANVVAGEGANLQRRTCAVHNVDIPWDPMTRRQRNGRADRQGNELDAVTIYDYLTLNSGDGPRFAKLAGKGTWIEEIIGSADEVAINPAAQVAVSPIELLADLTGNPDEARRLLRELEVKEQAERTAKIRARIARLLKAASDRFRAAEQKSDPVEAARLREAGRTMLGDLRQFDPAVWPFADHAARIEQGPVLVTKDAVLLWAGLRLARGSEYLEVGRIEEGSSFGLRESGSSRWRREQIKDFSGDGIDAASYTPAWPTDDEHRVQADIGRSLSDLGSLQDWEELGWMWASEAWLARYWPQLEPALAERLRVIGARVTAALPAVAKDGELHLVTPYTLRGVQLLPPGLAGWKQFVRLAQASNFRAAQLREAARIWWQRRLPVHREQAPEQPVAAPPPTVGAPDRPAEPPALLGETEEEREFLRRARANGLSEADTERRLAGLRRRAKYREALKILLPHRGVAVEERPDALILDPSGPSPYRKPATHFVSPILTEARTTPLAAASADATADLKQAEQHEARTHGSEAAMDVVLDNLRRDPGHYDDLSARARSEPALENVLPTTPASSGPTPGAASPPAAPAHTAEGLFQVIPTLHSKKRKAIWIVKLRREVPDAVFERLRDTASELGGHYSRYQSRDVPRGFLFWAKADADNFMARASGAMPEPRPNTEPSSPPAVPSAVPPAATVSGATPPAEPPPTQGSHFRIGDRIYVDGLFLRAMTERFPFTRPHPDLVYVDRPDGQLQLRHFRDDLILPGQRGPLYELTAASETGLRAAVAELKRDGLTDLRGIFPTWPTAAST